MVVSAPAATLLLATSVISTAAETLSVGAVGSVAVLAGSRARAHSVGTAMKVVSLQVAGITAIGSAHLGILRRREAALATRGIVGSRSGTRSAAKRRRGTGGRRFAITERLQVVSGARGRGLVLAVKRLVLRLERGGATSKAVVSTAKTAATQTRLATRLTRCGAAVLAEARTKATITVK